ncbi:hypothetical protein [Streptomyces sp. NPDC050504]|uniref:hypothetical protein n=1 Tax=Streptomyces sp. NPDC050504 TaxID=3365618 RepID=UPI0037BC0A7B
MSGQRPEGPGSNGAPAPQPVPRDLPDQQAQTTGTPWESNTNVPRHARDECPDPDVPDTDEAGTGRNTPSSDNEHPERPAPDESPA